MVWIGPLELKPDGGRGTVALIDAARKDLNKARLSPFLSKEDLGGLNSESGSEYAAISYYLR